MSKSDTMADIIRKAMERDPRTVYRLSQESGIDPAVLGRFIHGERGLNLDTAGRLCRVLGLELRPVRKGRR